MWKILNEHELDAALCFLDKTAAPADNLSIEIYNKKVENAILVLQKTLGTFAILEASNIGKKQSCILIEKGKFYGMGTLPNNKKIDNVNKLKDLLTPYPENETIYALVKSFMQKNEMNIVSLES